MSLLQVWEALWTQFVLELNHFSVVSPHFPLELTATSPPYYWERQSFRVFFFSCAGDLPTFTDFCVCSWTCVNPAISVISQQFRAKLALCFTVWMLLCSPCSSPRNQFPPVHLLFFLFFLANPPESPQIVNPTPFLFYRFGTEQWKMCRVKSNLSWWQNALGSEPNSFQDQFLISALNFAITILYIFFVCVWNNYNLERLWSLRVHNSIKTCSTKMGTFWCFMKTVAMERKGSRILCDDTNKSLLLKKTPK